MIRGGERARDVQLARFRTEAEAVAQLHHPNIVQIFDIGEVDGSPFVSLELLEGGSLGDQIASTPQPAQRTAELLVTLARAVQVAHHAGIVHRDLKPSNILFDAAGVPKITDFGLAKRLESDSRQTETGQVMGSPSYMAPEQASGRTREVGPAADVYALGTILYEMLTGRPPFKGETPIETVRMVIDADPVPPSQLVPRVARDLETICLKCLSKPPHKRYATAAAFAADLTRYLKGEPIEARRTLIHERAIKWSKRHPLRALLSASAALIIVLAPLGVMLRDRAEATRLDQLRTAAYRVIDTQRHEIEVGNLDGAQQTLLEMRSQLKPEPKLRYLRDEADKLLAGIENRRAAEKDRALADRANARDRGRFEEFHAKWNEALFNETGILQVVDQRKATEQSARAALAIFGNLGSQGLWELGPLPTVLSDAEKEEIREGSYELLLVLSDVAESSADAGLALDAALRLRQPTPAFHLRRAAWLGRANEPGRARAELHLAAQLKPTTPLDHFLLGKDAYKRNEYLAAIEQFDSVFETRPNHFWAHCIAGFCNMHLKRPQTAKAEFTSCLQTEPNFAWLYHYRGYASFQTAQLARAGAAELGGASEVLKREIVRSLELAERDFARGLKLLENNPSSQLRVAFLTDRGLLAFERHDWQNAATAFQSAIDLDGTQYSTYASLANALFKQGKVDEAIEKFTSAIALRGDVAALYRARAEILMAQKESTKAQRARAIGDLEQSIRLENRGSPRDPEQLCRDQVNRARLLLREGRDEEALAACDSALKVDSAYPPAHQMRLDLLRKLKRYDDLIRSCDAVIAGGKPTAHEYHFRALARENKREFTAAIEDLTQAIALRKGSAPLLLSRGQLYLVTDAPKSALRDFEEVIRLESTNADAFTARGLARVALGEYPEAVADASKALGMSEPTSLRLYKSARIYAKAAIAVSGDIRRQGRDAAALAERYQEQAVALVRKAVERQQSSEREAFLRDLRDVVQTDPAMKPLRRRLRAVLGG
jgi:tetratricopeptide (TPR) repeat protein